MVETLRHALPMLVPGQMNREVTLNSALQMADAMMSPVVESAPAVSPPNLPTHGQCFAVAAGATGGWAGHDGDIATWSEGSWLFIGVPEGAAFRVRNNGVPVVRTATGWEIGTVRGDRVAIGGVAVVQAQQAAISAPSAGTTVDAQARTAIGQILAALRAHGLIAT